ncbi:hypothetical protein KBTX_02264 [wastewater metagenome]|uniref:Uncharacterized protein n=2 Tax=unclassified sequences TaxID=12908 RepID=A0A5B8RGF3_9ZZZZ|nr:hypothetical protein [Arhodomonas sp. KWT]QEA05935.1 hypothetical protein KBTEX_02264 [uncultured organism]
MTVAAEGGDALETLVAGRLERPPPAAVAAVADALAERLGDNLLAVIAYGSCLRDVDPADGLIDLYAIVDGYRGAFGRRWLAPVTAALPPSVFYLEQRHEGRTLRAKYAVLSRRQLARGIGRWFHPYVWGRFAQPAVLAYRRDRAAAGAITALLARAVPRLIDETAPMLPGTFDAERLWARGLALSYATELRPERPDRVRGLVDHDRDHYRALTEAALPRLDGRLRRDPSGSGYHCTAGPWRRLRARTAWRARRLQGAALSILRLAKASATFDGGLDYAAWKLERHTGERVELSPRVRHHPLIFGWGVLWRLLRRGVLR